MIHDCCQEIGRIEWCCCQIISHALIYADSSFRKRKTSLSVSEFWNGYNRLTGWKRRWWKYKPNTSCTGQLVMMGTIPIGYRDTRFSRYCYRYRIASDLPVSVSGCKVSVSADTDGRSGRHSTTQNSQPVSRSVCQSMNQSANQSVNSSLLLLNQSKFFISKSASQSVDITLPHLYFQSISWHQRKGRFVSWLSRPTWPTRG